MELKHNSNDFKLGTHTNTHVDNNGLLSLKRKNLLDNSSFELECGLNDCFQKSPHFMWSVWKEGGSSDINVHSSDFSGGVNSHKIQFTSTTGKQFLFGQHITNIIQNAQYAFSCYVKMDNISDFEVKVECQLYKDDITYVTGTSSNYISASEYARISVITSVPTDANYIRAWITLRPKTGVILPKSCTLWIHSPQLEHGSVVTSYTKKYETIHGEYISPKLNIPQSNPHKLEITSSVPLSNNIKIQLRSAQTETEIESSQWRGSQSNTHNAYESVTIISGNKLLNPGFETLDSLYPNKPDKWGTWVTHPNYTFIYPEIGRNGGYSYSITGSLSTPISSTGLIVQNITTDIKKIYKLSGWFKTENVSGAGVQIGVDWKDSNGKWISGISSKSINGTNGWTYAEVICIPATTSSYATICLKLNGNSGRVYFDDISFEEAVIDYKEWSINPIHSTHEYIQYKLILDSNNLFYSPTVYDIRLKYDTSTPEIKDIELSSVNQGVSYKYYPNELITFKALVTDYLNISNIKSVNIKIYNESGYIYASAPMYVGNIIDSNNIYYMYNYLLPNNSVGTWKINTTVTSNTSTSITSETVFFKVHTDYKESSQKILIEGLGSYGLGGYKTSPQTIIDGFKKLIGVDIWKISFNWDILEPKRGQFNQEYLQFIRTLMDEAHSSGVKCKLALKQQNFPDWVNDGKWDNGSRYINHSNDYLIDTWKYLVTNIKDHPAVDSYLIINEENYVSVFTYQHYIKANNRIISAIKEIDTNTMHLIDIRPNHISSMYLTQVSSYGNHDVNSGIGTYPTGAEWWDTGQENPVSFTSYFSISANLHYSPLAFNGLCGVGEIGFWGNYTDNERLIAFERALSIAYDMGYNRFCVWGTGFDFKDKATYFPKLKQFRDSLYNRPRISIFNIRVLNDINTSRLIQEETIWTQKRILYPEKEPYFNLIKQLDEGGYSWFYTDFVSTSLQPVKYDATILLSKINGKTEAEQNTYISSILSTVTSVNRPKDWSYSLVEPIEIIKKNDDIVGDILLLLGGTAIIYGIYYLIQLKQNKYTQPTKQSESVQPEQTEQINILYNEIYDEIYDEV